MWRRELQRFAKQAFVKKLDAVANEIKIEAKTNAPVKTGRLRDSIDVIIVSENKRLIGSDVPYAWFVEMGTRKQRPRAYLRRALMQVFGRTM